MLICDRIALDTGDTATLLHTLTKTELEGYLSDAEQIAEGWVRTSGFKADRGQICKLPSHDGSLSEILIGMGDAAPDDDDPWWLASVVGELQGGTYRLNSQLAADKLAAAARGWCLAQYQFDRYLSEKTDTVRTLLLQDTVDIKAIQAEVKAIVLVRDLVNTPAEHMGPQDLELVARELCSEFDGKLNVISGEELANEFPAIYAVGRAAEKKPRLLDFTWGNPEDLKVTLVGKGVCFDSGGLNMKSAQYMRDMKKDMGGAAHAFGLARLIMERKLPVRLRLLVSAVENAVSGNAFRPGDILNTRKGLTVEVGNTDAEGRLVLCDALTFGDEEEPDIMIDFATLTGAARAALGPDLPALFSTNDAFADQMLEAGRINADPLWRMPLWQGYMDDLKSPIADLCNVTENSFAGAITAALYLQNFVEKCPIWIHIDTFAWNTKAKAGRSKGGAAMGVLATYGAINSYLSSNS